MNRMIISEEEKSRILEMHKNATSKQYLMERATTQPETIGGGGTAQEKLRNFTTTQAVYSIPSLNQKVITTSVVIFTN